MPKIDEIIYQKPNNPRNTIKGEDLSRAIEGDLEEIRRFNCIQFQEDQDYLQINDALITGKFAVMNTKIPYALYFSGCRFAEGFQLRNIDCERGISFERGSSCDGLFILNNVNCESSMSFLGFFGDQLQIGQSTIKTIFFQGGEIESISIHDNNITDLSISNIGKQVSVSKVSADATPMIEYLKVFPVQGSSLRVANYSIGRLVIGEFWENATAHFSNLSVNHLSIEQFRQGPNCNISMQKIEPFGENSQLSLIRSDLGRVRIWDCNWNKFNVCNFLNSSINEVSAQNVNWNDSVENSETQTKREKANVRREYYRQLKLLYARQKDRENELLYRKKELTNHLRSIGLFSKNGQTKITLWLSRVTNDFGTNWGRASFWIFVMALLFMAGFQIGLNQVVSLDFRILVGVFNPAHRLSNIVSSASLEKLPGIVYILDFVSRVVMGFLIFQFIRAFRKYNKT
jgi:hypothetical protein